MPSRPTTHFLLSLFCCLLPFQSGKAAQIDETKQPSVTLKQLSKAAKRWTVDHGLPSDQIHHIAQTPDGHIWVADHREVARLSNHSFETVSLHTLPGSTNQKIKKILSDSQGFLWVTLNNGQVFFLNNNSATFRKSKLPAPPSRSHIIAAPNNGGILQFSVERQELKVRHVTQTWHTLHSQSSLITQPLSSCHADSQGGLWLIEHSQNIHHYDGSEWNSIPRSTREFSLSKLFTNSNGEICICDPHGIYTVSKSGLRRIRTFSRPLPNDSTLGECVEDGTGNFWIRVGNNRLYVCQPDGKTRAINLSLNGFSPPPLKLFADNSGTIWIGSLRGLLQIAYSPFVTWEIEKNAVPYRLISITEDGDDTMWFACAGAVCYLDRDAPSVEFAMETEILDLTSSVKGVPYEGALVLLKNGKLYHIHKDGKKLLNSELSSQIPPHKIIPKGNITTPNGDHWVPTSKGLFYRKWSLGKSSYQHLSLPEPVGYGPLQTAYQGPDGKIYIAATGHGIFSVNPDTMLWKRLSPVDDLASKSIFAIHVDPQNRVWSLSSDTKKLALHLKGQHYQAPYKQLGFSDAVVCSTTSDLQGGMWFTTLKHGVAYANTESLIQKLKEPNTPLKLKWFDRSSGLATKACSFTTFGLCRSSNGHIWVANTNGVSVINPALWHAQRKKARDYPIHIEACLLDGSPVEGLHSSDTVTQSHGHFSNHDHRLTHQTSFISIPAEIKKIEIQYASINHTFLGETQYRYRLQGFDQEWIYAGTTPRAVYQHLPHGSYLFEIAAQHPGGSWSKPTNAVTLEVKPHWHQRTSVKFSLIMLVIATTVFSYRMRMRYLTKRSNQQAIFTRQLIHSQEEERKRIAGEIHDSLGQDLLLIKNSTELVKRKINPQSDVQSRLQDISEIATHAIKEARTITANLRPIELDRLGLRIAVQSMIDRIAENTALSIESELTDLEQNWQAEQEINIYRVIQEALNNVVKHAHAQNVSIVAHLAIHTLSIKLSDDGCGFNQESVKNNATSSGMGLNGLHERVNLLKGKLTIRSTPHKGTHLDIEIPTSQYIRLS